ncbi:MAG: preprotein translocase subunit YajC [Pseudomonadota bacterium]
MLWLMLLMFGLMYFLILRPQAKRAKEHSNMVQALSKGDEIVTNGGILGKIEKVDEQFLTLKIANNTSIRVQKHTVGAVMPKGTYKD